MIINYYNWYCYSIQIRFYYFKSCYSLFFFFSLFFFERKKWGNVSRQIENPDDILIYYVAGKSLNGFLPSCRTLFWILPCWLLRLVSRLRLDDRFSLFPSHSDCLSQKFEDSAHFGTWHSAVVPDFPPRGP